VRKVDYLIPFQLPIFLDALLHLHSRSSLVISEKTCKPRSHASFVIVPFPEPGKEKERGTKKHLLEAVPSKTPITLNGLAKGSQPSESLQKKKTDDDNRTHFISREQSWSST